MGDKATAKAINIGVRRSVYLALLCLTMAAVAFAMAGCSSGEDKSAGEEPAAQEETADGGADVGSGESSGIWDGYTEYLEANRARIEEFEEKMIGYDPGERESVSFCDIDGDGLPEMFVFATGEDEDVISNQMTILTWRGGAVEKLYYGVGLDGEPLRQGWAGGEGHDVAVYLGGEGNLYMTSWDDGYQSTCVSDMFTVNSEGKLEEKEDLVNVTVNDPDVPPSDIYYVDDRETPASEAAPLFTAHFSDVKDVIFCFGHRVDEATGEYDKGYGDLSLWDHIRPGQSRGMTCEEALAYLEDMYSGRIYQGIYGLLVMFERKWARIHYGRVVSDSGAALPGPAEAVRLI